MKRHISIKGLRCSIPWLGVIWLLFASNAFGQSRPADFGNQWVRSHPFTLAGWYSGDAIHYGDPVLFANSGLNTVSDIYMPTASMHLYAGMGGIGPSNEQFIANAKASYPNLTGWIVYDEPGPSLFSGIADVVSYLKQNDPDNLVYVNIGGATGTPASFSQYIDDSFTAMQPDVLSFTGQYPFRNSGSRFYPYHFASMMVMREKAKFYNVPYFVNVQAFEDLPYGYVLPTATEYRAEVYSYLTAGAKGIWNWQYEANHVSQALVSQGSPGVPSVPSALYPTAAAVNAEVKILGSVLTHLESTDVRFVPGGANATPAGLANWTPGAGSDPHIVSITSTGVDGLIGFFRDDNDQPYFMLTNLNHGPNLSEFQAGGAFDIVFDASINEIYRLNRYGGQINVIHLVNHTLMGLELYGGHGDLFNYSGNFIPEPSGGLLMGMGVLVALSRRRRA